jgi:hypothetical protein
MRIVAHDPEPTSGTKSAVLFERERPRPEHVRLTALPNVDSRPL